MTTVEYIFWIITCILAAFYGAYYLLMCYASRSSRSKKDKNKRYPTVSLIISTYNEDQVITSKLQNTLKLKYPKEKLEVIVVDSGSSDKTQQKVQDFLKKNDKNMNAIMIIENERKGKASALNMALKSCINEIVIITDADVKLKTNSISKIAARFADPNVGAVTGRAVVEAHKSLSTNIEKNYRSFFSVLRQGESNLDSTPIFNGPLSAYRRDLIDELKENTVTDDIELAMRVREKGFRTLFESEAIFYERYPSTLRGRIKQKKRRAQGIIQALLRHSKMIFRSTYGMYGFIILPSHFFMSIFSPILVLALLVLFAMTILFGPSILLVGALILLLIFEPAFKVFSKRIGKNLLSPMNFILTFFDGQFSLLLGMISLLHKPDFIWEKDEEIRFQIYARTRTYS